MSAAVTTEAATTAPRKPFSVRELPMVRELAATIDAAIGEGDAVWPLSTLSFIIAEYAVHGGTQRHHHTTAFLTRFTCTAPTSADSHSL